MQALIISICIIAAFNAAIIAACMLAEHVWPARPVPARHRDTNLALGLFGIILMPTIQPIAGALSTLLLNRAGSGFITLPASGWGWLFGFATYALAMDFGEYVFHRAQHAIPLLWRMHSLHHSELHYNATTAVRNFWLEPYLKSVSVWLAVGLLFRVSPTILTAYGILAFYNYVIHTNTRLHLGGLSWLLNAPAYHRIHHSALPEDQGCNYAALFPIFDVLSGAYRPPGEGLFPPTGIDSDPAPVGFFRALAWPFAREDARLSPSDGAKGAAR